MASYAMAHLKLDMLLSDTGYKPNTNNRLRVYLTNSLEEHHPDTGSLFVQALANEANQANYIKRDTPVMVVVGNPPYNGDSKNQGKWIMDLMGKRQMKYEFLAEHTLFNSNFVKIYPTNPQHSFIPKDVQFEIIYNSGFSLSLLFIQSTAGIVTANDSVLVGDNKKDVLNKVSHYYNEEANEQFISKIGYRPFDYRYIYIDNTKVERSRIKVMQHCLYDDNLSLATIRINKEKEFSSVFVTNNIADARFCDRFMTAIFPLYLYLADSQTTTDGTTRIPNLKPEIVADIAARIALTFEAEKSGDTDKFAPIDLLDYIYGVLHTPAYRERYREFLKVDFPRIPYPENAEQFFKIGAIGGELRRTHLMEELPPITTTYPISETGLGRDSIDNIVVKPSSDDTAEDTLNIYINDTQYFGAIPVTAWNHYIGGYQPAQKWLKDRKGKTLTFDDLQHYQRIIAALVRTSELMAKL